MLENPVITETVKAIVPQTYEDIAHKGFVQTGKAIEGLAKFIFLPFKCLGYTADELEKRYKDSLERVNAKLEGKQCVPPNPATAAKLLDHIKFVFDEPALLQFYEELLASAIAAETAPYCRSSFTSNLIDMSPSFTLHRLLSSKPP